VTAEQVEQVEQVEPEQVGFDAFPLDKLGACRDCDPALFWYREFERKALAVCDACPVLDACRAWALTTPVSGVAGGLTELQRNRVRGHQLPDLHDGLDAQEIARQVVACVEQGMTVAQVARHLGVSQRTVRLYRPAAVIVLRPCGTDSAYYRHRKHGEDPCLPCRAAHAKEARAREARNREQRQAAAA
jgi:hypothetical protein